MNILIKKNTAKILKLIALIMFPLICVAQDWFGENDVWTNHLYGGLFGQFAIEGFEEVTIAGDSLVDGKTYKILKRRYARHVLGQDTLFQFYEPHLVREKNDSVFHWYEGVEHLIYDFNMEVGDSLVWYVLGCPVTLRIDSLYSKNIDGSMIEIQEGLVDSEGHFLDRFVRIYKGIGVLESKFDHWDTTWVYDWTLLGFLLPNESLTCFLDYIPPSLCSFTSDSLSVGGGLNSCRYISSTTQDWFYQNGEWVYNFGGMFDPTTYARILKHEPTEDTIINGETWRLMSNVEVSLSGPDELEYVTLEPYILRSENRRLYYWTGDTTHLVYDFNMAPGDSIEWYPDQFESTPVESCQAFFVLDSLSIENIYDLEYHVQHGRIINRFWDEETKIQIYESIGWVQSYDDYNGYWHSSGFLIPELNLACYYDNAGQGEFCQYTSFFGNSYPMEETNCFDLVSSTESSKIDLEIKIAPNPVSSILQLEGSIASFDAYIIYNINGQLIANAKLSSTSIIVEHLIPGLYFLYLQGDSGDYKTLKFSKTK